MLKNILLFAMKGSLYTANEQLLKELHRGNSRIIKQLYDSFFAPLCAYADNFVNNELVAGDIVQEVFIKFWEKRKKFDSIYAIRSFFYISVKNACLNYLRDRKKNLTIEFAENHFVEQKNLVIEEEVHRMISDEIARLPTAMKKVFELVLLDMSVSQIADALNISKNTVRNQKAMAKKKLREKLKNWVFLLFL